MSCCGNWSMCGPNCVDAPLGSFPGDPGWTDEDAWGPLCSCLAAPSPHRHATDGAGLFIEPDTAPGHAGMDRCDECGWTA